MRKLLGYSLLIISCIAFAALPVIPFLPLESSQKAAWGGGVFVFAEVTWWLSIPLLGKEVKEFTQRLWRWIKTVLRDDEPRSSQAEVVEPLAEKASAKDSGL